MSLLWPRPLHVHLFPGMCRLESPHIASPHFFTLDVSDNVEQILQKLDTQLIEQAGLVTKHKTVSFTLSDHFSAVSLMPWQDALSSPDEISNYARLCLEDKVTTAEHDWVLHAEFNAYQQPGIVYAFSQALLSGLDSLSQKHYLKLRQVLPISARVFFNRFKKSNKDQQIALLIEPTRSTLITYINNKIHEIDVEPTFDTSLNTINRLLRRLEINDNKTISVLVWSNEEPIHTDMSSLIESHLTSASITNLPVRFWRNY